MRVLINYERAKKLAPESVKEILAKLKTTQSKAKGSKPEDLKWKIEFALDVSHAMMTGSQFIAHISGGKMSPKTQKPSSKDRQDVIDYYQPKTTWWVAASKGHWSAGSSKDTKGKYLPDELVECYTEGLKEEEKMQTEVATMTPEERHKQTMKDLKELSQDPGFFAVSFPRK